MPKTVTITIEHTISVDEIFDSITVTLPSVEVTIDAKEMVNGSAAR